MWKYIIYRFVVNCDNFMQIPIFGGLLEFSMFEYCCCVIPKNLAMTTCGLFPLNSLHLLFSYYSPLFTSFLVVAIILSQAKLVVNSFLQFFSCFFIYSYKFSLYNIVRGVDMNRIKQLREEFKISQI